MEGFRVNYFDDKELFMEEGFAKVICKDTVLDIGCGIRPREEINAGIYICCEPYSEYVKELKKARDKVGQSKLLIIVEKDWAGILNFLPKKSVDTVLLIDVLEHLEKEDGAHLLRKTEDIARLQIAIFTPLGYIEQKELSDGKDAWGFDGVAFQQHLSGWYPEDFDDTWELMVCNDFHVINNLGEDLEIPVGAIWALKNINDSTDTDNTIELISLFKSEIFNEITRLQRDLNTMKNEFVKYKAFCLKVTNLYIYKLLMVVRRSFRACCSQLRNYLR